MKGIKGAKKVTIDSENLDVCSTMVVCLKNHISVTKNQGLNYSSPLSYLAQAGISTGAGWHLYH